MKPCFTPFDADSLRNESHILFRRSGQEETLAYGAVSCFERNSPQNGLLLLEKYLKNTGRQVFGHLSYTLKDGIEKLNSSGTDSIGFPVISFFEPKQVFERTQGEKWIRKLGNDPIPNSSEQVPTKPNFPVLEPQTTKNQYLTKLLKIKEHLKRGDVYELNYCIEQAAKAEIDPFDLFLYLDKQVQAPHAAFYRKDNRFAICMSPEGFLKATDGHVTTKPMKGTRPRSGNPEEDEALRLELAQDEKERAEHVMAVDVARNDLSRIAKKESVAVKSLCEVKTFSNVHQMISEVYAQMKEGITHIDLLKATFPMASMTGAPKISAMQLIEELEKMQRGIYSGCIGSLDLNKRLDMNVVIRTIEYNASTNAISLKTGGAITALSDSESEYDEMMIKAASITEHLSHV